MDSDISNSSSDILRNVVMGRVTEDGSWTEIGRFSDANITFHGEEMPEELTTKHLRPWNEVSFTAELLEPTIAQKIADEIYTELITPFLLQMAEQLAQIYGNLASYLYGAQETTTIRDEIEKRLKPPVRDIPWLKKQLKHCKNPMERKQLERELNAAFREKKRRRKKNVS